MNGKQSWMILCDDYDCFNVYDKSKSATTQLEFASMFNDLLKKKKSDTLPVLIVISPSTQSSEKLEEWKNAARENVSTQNYITMIQNFSSSFFFH